MIAVVGVFGVAYAQEGAAPASPPTTPQADPTTAAQMVASAKALLPMMDSSAQVVRRELTVAREQKDVVKALCLNDKLNQIDLAIRTATDRVGGLESAASANDLERSRHQYTVVLVLKDRVATLVSESNQCIGEETGFVGESAVTVEVVGVPNVDPTQPQTNAPTTTEAPVASPPPETVASPTMPDM
ncbi:MAG TPA: hypothetical protein VMI54_09655 [Polyangiaceae bacterium]|nr:hypothetical protein [Polyangiaceae bacterium]